MQSRPASDPIALGSRVWLGSLPDGCSLLLQVASGLSGTLPYSFRPRLKSVSMSDEGVARLSPGLVNTQHLANVFASPNVLV